MTRTSPPRLLVHVVWATLAPAALPRDFDPALASVMAGLATAIGCDLLAAGAASDHVHVLLALRPVVALSTAVQRLKGGSAHEINVGGVLPARVRWQAGYWAESCSPGDAESVAAYLLAHRDHHDDHHPCERWRRDDDAHSFT
jgi:REP element-mobilizing transposase RayT